MPIGPIDPSMAVGGGDWQVPGISGIDGAAPGTPGAGELDGAQQSQALAAGEAADPSQVVMAVERARLGMQLASQIRTKLVDAQQDIFHTQV